MMARVKFSEEFKYRRTGQSVTVYAAGREYTVKRECADEAIAAGKAKEVTAPPRKRSGKNPKSRKAPTEVEQVAGDSEGDHSRRDGENG